MLRVQAKYRDATDLVSNSQVKPSNKPQNQKRREENGKLHENSRIFLVSQLQRLVEDLLAWCSVSLISLAVISSTLLPTREKTRLRVCFWYALPPFSCAFFLLFARCSFFMFCCSFHLSSLALQLILGCCSTYCCTLAILEKQTARG